MVYGEEKAKKENKKEEKKKEKREYVAAKKQLDLQFLMTYYVKKRDKALKKLEEKEKNKEEGEKNEEELNKKKLRIIEKYNNRYKKIVEENKIYLDGLYLGSSYPKELPRVIPSGQFQREFFKRLFGERKPKEPIVPIEYILDQRGIKDARRRAANAKHYAKKTGGFYNANFYKTGRKKEDFFGEKEKPEEEEIDEEVEEEEPKEELIHLEEEESESNDEEKESSSDSESSSSDESGEESSEESEVNNGRLPPPIKKKDDDDEDEEIKIKKITMKGVFLKKKRSNN